MTVGHLKRFLRCKLDLPLNVEVCKTLMLEICILRWLLVVIMVITVMVVIGCNLVWNISDFYQHCISRGTYFQYFDLVLSFGMFQYEYVSKYPIGIKVGTRVPNFMAENIII